WCRRLEVLRLFIYSNFNIGHFPHIGSLLSSINTCRTLRHLTFLLQNSHYYESDSKPAFELPFLGWLEEFHCNFNDYRSEICEQLVKHGASNRNLKSIALFNMTTDMFEKHFYSMSDDFRRKISQL